MTKRLLFSSESLHGHVADDTPEGAVYRDDGSRVDPDNPRACFGCKLHVRAGGHDPCIANLPGTRHACCGHGLDRTPLHDNPAGCVAFETGRTMRFSGLVGGERIRAAVDAVLRGENPPEGFTFDADLPWWHGLTDNQRTYVTERIAVGVQEQVRTVLNGQPLSEAYLLGQAPWWDGLTEEQKALVWASFGPMLAALVREALAQVSAGE